MVIQGAAPGAALLRGYIEKHKLTRSGAARQLMTSAAAIQYWITGAQRPRADARERIEKWSAGEVPSSSWLRPEEAAKLEAVELMREPPAAEDTEETESTEDAAPESGNEPVRESRSAS